MRRADPTSARQRQPWREHGVSRATWFRQRARAGETGKATAPRETGKPVTDIAAESEVGKRETGKRETVTRLRVIEGGPPPLPVITARNGGCAQCGERDSTEVLIEINNAMVKLHRLCRRFYIETHNENHVDIWSWPWPWRGGARC
jgi:hypothetical protein